MRYLLISILCLCCFGCKVAVVDDFTTVDHSEKEIENVYFSDPNQDYVYKAAITFYGKAFSGLLIIKKIGEEKHRVLCTTQFGNTLFDIEFHKDTHTVRSVIEDLNKKIVLNTLRRDFEVLLKEHRSSTAQYQNQTHEVLKNKEANRYHYYFYERPNRTLSKIVHTTKHKEKFTIQFDTITEQVAEQIHIEHKHIKLSIHLQLLKK